MLLEIRDEGARAIGLAAIPGQRDQARFGSPRIGAQIYQNLAQVLAGRLTRLTERME